MVAKTTKRALDDRLQSRAASDERMREGRTVRRSSIICSNPPEGYPIQMPGPIGARSRAKRSCKSAIWHPAPDRCGLPVGFVEPDGAPREQTTAPLIVQRTLQAFGDATFKLIFAPPTWTTRSTLGGARRSRQVIPADLGPHTSAVIDHAISPRPSPSWTQAGHSRGSRRSG